MILRQQFEKECEGWKAIANKSVIANYTNEYVHWLEYKVEQLQNTSSNSDYAKCKIEAEIKRLEENPEGDYVTRISALEWALRIIAGR